MTTRVLPKAEYGRLVGLECEPIAAVLPDGGEILVVEDPGGIVGAWAVFPLWHVEGISIAPAHRGKSAVARRLLEAMQHAAQRLGARAFVTASVSAEVSTMLRKLGAVQLEGEHFSLKVGP